MKKTALITGSAGLIGSQSVEFLIEKGFKIVGIDNDMRAYFFGPEASTKENKNRPESSFIRSGNPLGAVENYQFYDGGDNLKIMPYIWPLRPQKLLSFMLGIPL